MSYYECAGGVQISKLKASSISLPYTASQDCIVVVVSVYAYVYYLANTSQATNAAGTTSRPSSSGTTLASAASSNVSCSVSAGGGYAGTGTGAAGLGIYYVPSGKTVNNMSGYKLAYVIK